MDITIDTPIGNASHDEGSKSLQFAIEPTAPPFFPIYGASISRIWTVLREPLRDSSQISILHICRSPSISPSHYTHLATWTTQINRYSASSHFLESATAAIMSS